MLRSLLTACRQACACSRVTARLPKVALNRQYLQQENPALASNALKHDIHLSASSWTTDRDIHSNKRVLRQAQESQTEQLDEVEDGEEEHINLEGLSEAGHGGVIPTLETHAMLVNGVRYDQLPIVHIHTSSNNTIILITDHTGTSKILQESCGTQGFHNVNKGTNVAAQTTGFAIGKSALEKDLECVRVCVNGIGAGRLASIKGLKMAGLKIVSLTDTTPVPHNGPKPRKPKKGR